MLPRGLSNIGLNGTSPGLSPLNLLLQNRWVIRCSLPSLAISELEEPANFCNASCAFSLASSSSSTDKLHKYQGRQSQKLVFTWWGQMVSKPKTSIPIPIPSGFFPPFLPQQINEKKFLSHSPICPVSHHFRIWSKAVAPWFQWVWRPLPAATQRPVSFAHRHPSWTTKRWRNHCLPALIPEL